MFGTIFNPQTQCIQARTYKMSLNGTVPVIFVDKIKADGGTMAEMIETLLKEVDSKLVSRIELSSRSV